VKYVFRIVCALLSAASVGTAVSVVQSSRMPNLVPAVDPVVFAEATAAAPLAILPAAVPPETAASTTTQPTAARPKPVNYAKVKGNKITDGTEYTIPRGQEKDEDPEYRRAAAPKPTAAPTTEPPGTRAPDANGTAANENPGKDTAAKTAPQNGWHAVSAKRYYYRSGKVLTGYQTISGRKYFFEKDGTLSSKVGIDVSKWNGNIDWAAVRASGVDYAMIRVGYRGFGKAGTIVLDERFKQNILGAAAAGLDCGVYFYTQAITAAEAKAEANFVLAAIEGFTLTYPIAYDLEDAGSSTARTNGLTNKQRTDFALAFCDTIKKAGHRAVYYVNLDWLTRIVDTTRLAGYELWLAHYTPGVTSCTQSFRMWQYSDKGRVNGISGDVDLNIELVDYRSEKPSAPAPQPSVPAPQPSAPAPQTSAPAPQTSAPAPQTSAPTPQSPEEPSETQEHTKSE